MIGLVVKRVSCQLLNHSESIMKMPYLVTVLAVLSVIGGIKGGVLNSENDIEGTLNIINSNYTTIKKYPWDVSFLVAKSIWGAGVILNSDWVLTTGFNCLWLDPSFISVRVGSTNWSTGGLLVGATKCVIHENYTGSWDYNIALLKLKESIILNGTTTKVVKLANNPASKSVGKSLTVTGWGVRTKSYEKETRLQKASQTVLSDDECKKIYNTTASTHFCASNPEQGPCVWDFGAPIINQNFLTLIGLYVGSNDCTDPSNNPSVYVDVFQFKSWINNIITDNSSALF